MAELSQALGASDWPAVSRAHTALLALEAQALPVLTAMIDAPRLVRLEHTADLIYPGAKKFYGHGGAIRVDLDWTHVRAGWVLEGLVFESFGFAAGTVHDGRTLQGGQRGPEDFPKAALAAAKAWLAAHASGWQRLAALREALVSGDAERQGMAVGWLRAPDAPMRGFSVALYDAELEPTVEKLAGAAGHLGEDAARLLKEAADPYWRGRVAKLMATE
ncbi:MAG: hypothetical protein IT373_35210 [Polyangiaceae bacterium]|nr:hypothetical protein [Polyangiaceae bacterium]